MPVSCSRKAYALAATGGGALAASCAGSPMAFAGPAAPSSRVYGSSSGRAAGLVTAEAGAPARSVTGAQHAASIASAAGAVVGSAVVAASRLQKKRQRRSAVQRLAAVTEVATKQKKDLGATLPDCPRTVWKADGIDVENLPAVAETAPLIVDAKELGEQLQAGMELEYFEAERERIMEQLQKHGAILFRNFETMHDAAGFRSFYESLQLNPCLDPIHTSGLRDMIDKKDAVYEAVNKPSLAQHVVGLHNESTFVKTAMYGAFVCFQPASEGGGEFMLADGAKIINDFDKDVLRRLYERKVRISVSNLDLNFVDAIPNDDLKKSTKGFLQDLILKAVAPKFDMDLEMVYGADTSNPWRLQAIEHAQSPINTHPVTGQPVWFCNMHNHSRYLRDRRPCTVPEVGMTDVYFGDLSRIPPEDVDHVNAVCERNIVPIMMQKGDVILLDNYRVLHGRKTFKGDRKHAVTWFESCGEPLQRDESRDRPDDFMNNLINKTLV